MSWIDKSLMSEPKLLALLQPDERLLAVASAAAPLSGVERIIEPPPPPTPPRPPLTGGERVMSVAVAAVGAVVAPTGWSGGELPERMLGGTAVLGTPSSAGVSMLRNLRAAPASSTLAVTDRRILLVGSESRKQDDPSRPGKRVLAQQFQVLGGYPRASLVAARRRGRLGARGRVELYFGDGSMVAVMTGIVLTGPARRILRTLALPKVP